MYALTDVRFFFIDGEAVQILTPRNRYSQMPKFNLISE